MSYGEGLVDEFYSKDGILSIKRSRFLDTSEFSFGTGEGRLAYQAYAP